MNISSDSEVNYKIGNQFRFWAVLKLLALFEVKDNAEHYTAGSNTCKDYLGKLAAFAPERRPELFEEIGTDILRNLDSGAVQPCSWHCTWHGIVTQVYQVIVMPYLRREYTYGTANGTEPLRPMTATQYYLSLPILFHIKIFSFTFGGRLIILRLGVRKFQKLRNLLKPTRQQLYR